MDPGSHDRGGSIRRSDIAVAMISIASLAMLLIPALAQSRANDDRATCLDRSARLMRGLHYYADVFKWFPTASTQPITAKPGQFGKEADSAGYSWLAKILPFVGEGVYYDRLNESSDHFRKQLYDPAVTGADSGADLPARAHQVKAYLCPSFDSQHQPASDAPSGSEGTTQRSLPALSNYHALAATHFYNQEGIGRLVPPDRLRETGEGAIVANVIEGNGVLVFPGYVGDRIFDRGLSLGVISDGNSNTVLFAETIESEIGRWLDGQETWMVAAWPGNPDAPTGLAVEGSSTPILKWSEEQLARNWTSLAESASRDTDDQKSVYLPADRWSAGKNRRWGPSSYHEGVVSHAFADGQAKMLNTDIDKNVYLHLVTRNGRETIPEEFRRWPEGSRLILVEEGWRFGRHTDKSGRFSYVIPGGWQAVNVPEFAHEVLMLQLRDGRRRNVVFTEELAKGSLDELKARYERALPRLKNFTLIESHIGYLRDGRKAVSIIHTNSNPAIMVRQVNYIVDIGDRRYFIACTVLLEDGDKYDDIFANTVASTWPEK